MRSVSISLLFLPADLLFASACLSRSLCTATTNGELLALLSAQLLGLPCLSAPFDERTTRLVSVWGGVAGLALKCTRSILACCARWFTCSQVVAVCALASCELLCPPALPQLLIQSLASAALGRWTTIAALAAFGSAAALLLGGAKRVLPLRAVRFCVPKHYLLPRVLSRLL